MVALLRVEKCAGLWVLLRGFIVLRGAVPSPPSRQRRSGSAVPPHPGDEYEGAPENPLSTRALKPFHRSRVRRVFMQGFLGLVEPGGYVTAGVTGTAGDAPSVLDAAFETIAAKFLIDTHPSKVANRYWRYYTLLTQPTPRGWE